MADNETVNKELIRLYNEPDHGDHYLGKGMYSKIIKYHDDLLGKSFAYKIYPIVTEPEPGIPDADAHVKLLKEEVAWQHIASKQTKSKKAKEDDAEDDAEDDGASESALADAAHPEALIKLAPSIHDYYIYKSDGKEYFIIKMDLLDNYIDVDELAQNHPRLFHSDYLINRITELTDEKERRKIPDIGDGSRYLAALFTSKDLPIHGTQALVNVNKLMDVINATAAARAAAAKATNMVNAVKSAKSQTQKTTARAASAKATRAATSAVAAAVDKVNKDDSIFLIDFGNVMDFKDSMKNLLQANDGYYLKGSNILKMPVNALKSLEHETKKQKAGVNKNTKKMKKSKKKMRKTKMRKT